MPVFIRGFRPRTHDGPELHPRGWSYFAPASENLRVARVLDPQSRPPPSARTELGGGGIQPHDRLEIGDEQLPKPSIRKAINDTTWKKRSLIETLPKRDFRFYQHSEDFDRVVRDIENTHQLESSYQTPRTTASRTAAAPQSLYVGTTNVQGRDEAYHRCRHFS